MPLQLKNERVMNMKNMHDVQQLLKKYGIFIYTGDREGDLDLIGMEVDDLYKAQMITLDLFRQCRLLLSKEKQNLFKERAGK